MKIIANLLLAASICVFCASSAKADTITGTGTWGAGTPTTAESAAGDTWAFSFVVSNPVTDAVAGGFLSEGFLTHEVSDFTYLLNGSPVASTLSGVVFYPTADGGLFDLELSDGDVVSIGGSQAFGGTPPPDMTIIDGVYTAQSSMNDGSLTGSGTVTIAATATTPEPGTLSLLILGLFVVTLIYGKNKIDFNGNREVQNLSVHN